MIRQIAFAFLLVSISGLTNGCDDPSPIIPTIIDETPNISILPLKAGNVWFHKLTQYPVLGNKDSSYYDSSWVNRDTIINNERWYNSSYGIVRNRPTGLWLYNKLLLSYPSYVGEVNKISSWSITTISLAETVSTSFGKYSCYHYRTELYDMRSEAYVVPNIGYLRIDYFQRQNGTDNWFQVLRSDLQSAKLN